MYNENNYIIRVIYSMDLKEFFMLVGGDYDEIMSRLLSERIILKYVLRFKEDTSLDELRNAFSENNTEVAFRIAHTLKGVCSTFGLGNLYKYSYELTETLRDQSNIDMDKAKELFIFVEKYYIETKDLINKL